MWICACICYWCEPKDHFSKCCSERKQKVIEINKYHTADDKDYLGECCILVNSEVWKFILLVNGNKSVIFKIDSKADVSVFDLPLLKNLDCS